MTSTTVSEHQGERAIERGEALSASMADEGRLRDGEAAVQATPAGPSASARVWADKSSVTVGAPVQLHVAVTNSAGDDEMLAVVSCDLSASPGSGAVLPTPWLASPDPIPIPPRESRSLPFTITFIAPGIYKIFGTLRCVDYRVFQAEPVTIAVRLCGE